MLKTIYMNASRVNGVNCSDSAQTQRLMATNNNYPRKQRDAIWLECNKMWASTGESRRVRGRHHAVLWPLTTPGQYQRRTDTIDHTRRFSHHEHWSSPRIEMLISTNVDDATSGATRQIYTCTLFVCIYLDWLRLFRWCAI